MPNLKMKILILITFLTLCTLETFSQSKKDSIIPDYLIEEDNCTRFEFNIIQSIVFEQHTIKISLECSKKLWGACNAIMKVKVHDLVEKKDSLISVKKIDKEIEVSYEFMELIKAKVSSIDFNKIILNIYDQELWLDGEHYNLIVGNCNSEIKFSIFSPYPIDEDDSMGLKAYTELFELVLEKAKIKIKN